MQALIPAGHDRTWLLAVATLGLGVSVAVGRSHGNAIDFIAGFFLGLSLAVSAGYLILAFVRRTSS